MHLLILEYQQSFKFISSTLAVGLVHVNVVLPQAELGHSLGVALVQDYPQRAGAQWEGERDESKGRVLFPASWPWCQGMVTVMFNLLLLK